MCTYVCVVCAFKSDFFTKMNVVDCRSCRVCREVWGRWWLVLLTRKSKNILASFFQWVNLWFYILRTKMCCILFSSYNKHLFTWVSSKTALDCYNKVSHEAGVASALLGIRAWQHLLLRRRWWRLPYNSQGDVCGCVCFQSFSYIFTKQSFERRIAVSRNLKC